MAYKKYIKRGGKTYGPYIYHSRRIGGKVISEYHGPRKPDYKKIFSAIFGVVFLVALIFILVFSEKEMTGKAVLDLDKNYQQGKALEGNLKLSLQEGELIPVSSKLVFENNQNIFEYDLKELVPEEEFGEGYLGNESKEIIIDVSALGLILEQGNLTIRLVDSGQEILSLLTILEEGTVSINETIPEPTPEPTPESAPAPEPVPEPTPTSYQTQTEIYVPELIVSLTEQERAILIEEFGNTLNVKEAAPQRGFIKVRYELGGYWAEFNYDANSSRETLESFKYRDMKKWLKDLARSLSEEQEIEEEVSEYQTSF